MDITTSYLGFKLKSPIVPSAGPLSEDVSKIKEMEDIIEDKGIKKERVIN